jgi:hypothetical protein
MCDIEYNLGFHFTGEDISPLALSETKTNSYWCSLDGCIITFEYVPSQYSWGYCSHDMEIIVILPADASYIPAEVFTDEDDYVCIRFSPK